jgi:hypothetical protein
VIGILQEILCALERLAALIVNGLVAVVNQVIVGVAIMLEALLSLLPDMPEAPAPPSSGVLGFMNWFVPLAPLASLLVTMGGLFGAYMLVRIGLNWMRAL